MLTILENEEKMDENTYYKITDTYINDFQSIIKIYYFFFFKKEVYNFINCNN